MHEEYFKPQQAPIIIILYDTSLFNFDDSFPEMTTLLEANEFMNNTHMQIEVIDLKFQGSLI